MEIHPKSRSVLSGRFGVLIWPCVYFLKSALWQRQEVELASSYNKRNFLSFRKRKTTCANVIIGWHLLSLYGAAEDNKAKAQTIGKARGRISMIVSRAPSAGGMSGGEGRGHTLSNVRGKVSVIVEGAIRWRDVWGHPPHHHHQHHPKKILKSRSILSAIIFHKAFLPKNQYRSTENSFFSKI